ncbi:hypothetical protein [Tautonia marina]|uniref:hypothetical protein n=1 Tax=Tautonia marina TaxID=2653855 RepID=UPI001260993B|nr:hypothetical protein [Tautonia marina]
MNDRADFYIVENIIGYTGQIDQNPTVYFLTSPAQGPNEYGHITQSHQIGPNEGRETVRRSSMYEIRVGPGGELEEWDGGRCIHRSRNPLIPIAGLSAKSRYLLSCSIARFTEKKRIDRFTEQQIDELYDYGVVLGR